MMMSNMKYAVRISRRYTFRRSVRYFSVAEEVPVEDTEAKAREDILNAAMEHVNRRGWSTEAIAAGALDAGYSPSSHGLFPRGAAELAENWMEIGNHELSKFLDERSSTGIKGDELVSSAIFFRLQHNIPYLRSWPQAMASGLLPDNLPFTMQKLHTVTQSICDAADKVDDSKVWQERQSLIGTVYAASELYMLTDYSEGYEETKKFIAGRLSDSITLQDRAGPAVDILDGVLRGIGSLVGAAGSVAKPPTSPFSFGFPTAPPHPKEVFDGLSEGATKASKTIQDIARSPNPIHSTLTALNTIISQQQHQSTTAHNPGPSSTPTSHTPPPSASSLDDDFEQNVGLAPVKLPSGLSLFGLLSMNGTEAAEIVKSSNPDFTVLKTDASDELSEPLMEDKVVRLLVDENNVVVDVLRS